MNLNAEEYKTIIFDDGGKIYFPEDISISDEENGVRLVTITWLDEDGYLQFRTEDVTRVIFEKKMSGGIIG